MQNKNSYTIVGLFFIACVFAFAVFMWWMSDSDKNVNYKNYYIITTELPSGIRVESVVKYAGVDVGSVKNIEFQKDSNIRITLKVRDDVPIKADSLAGVEQNIISGISTINISRGERDFDSDERIIELNKSLLEELKNNAQSIGDKIHESLERLDAVASSENLQHFNNTLKGVDGLVNGLNNEENLKNISEILANLNAISSKIKPDELNAILVNLNKTLNNINALSSTANDVVNGFSKTSKMINEKIKNGEYDVKKMFEPTLDETNSFLQNFSKTLREVRNALNRLEDNPYEFFFKDTNIEDKK
ncbi:hypothetical protein LMG7974_01735 [Campylobacter majalis]|uniref:Mce/MlaD domain-containing protein n=1 Tax=Campylobacter majalis TaxID=2790656 RepID=A0ABM8Q9J2_9BACT|nr:MlaD family protein [Campylobacter majalis]CAD7289658.1 hypothetical protein LMG7974_01735 [Campylobacter majalis]